MNLNSIGRLALHIVMPVTDFKPLHSTLPWLVELQPTPENGLVKVSAADTFQTKSLSLSRFARRLGTLAPPQINTIAEAIALCVGAT
jgi:mRNA interferase MazF